MELVGGFGDPLHSLYREGCAAGLLDAEGLFVDAAEALLQHRRELLKVVVVVRHVMGAIDRIGPRR